MQTTTIKFSWNQELESYHPDFSILARFTGWAAITGEDVEIKSCRVKWDGSLEGEDLSVLEGSIGSMQNYFIGKCREAARNAFYKTQNVAVPKSSESAAIQHNGGFVPRASDTKYMQDRGDRFPDVQIDRS